MINLFKLKKIETFPLKKLLYVNVLIILYIKQFLFSSDANNFLKTFTNILQSFLNVYKSVFRIYKLLFCQEKNFRTNPKLQREQTGCIKLLSENFVNFLHFLWIPLSFLLSITILLNQMFLN